MQGYTKSKAELRELLQKQCDEAVFLDSSIYTLYAAEPEPPKQAHLRQKTKPLKPTDLELPAQAALVVESHVVPDDQSCMKGLEAEIEAFMKNRR